MTCKEMERLLAGLIDGALSDEERGRVEEHLRSCGSCRNAFADLKRSDDLVKRLGEVEPPPWLKTRVMARVREEAQGRQSILRKLFFPLHIKVPIQALATVLVAVVAWNVYRTGETDFRQAAPPPVVIQDVRKAEAPQEKATAAEGAKNEEGPASREKKAPAPPATGEGRAERKAGPARDAAQADAVGAARLPEEAAGTVASSKDEEKPQSAGAVARQETARDLAASEPQRKQKALKAPLGAAPGEATKGEAAPAAAPMLSANLSARPDLDITVRAKDPLAAAGEAEEALRKIGARSIERKTREGQVTLTARIRPEHLDAFREKLASLGKLSESAAAAPRPGVPLAIRLEIRPE
ncbi:MAG: DUF2275 domain-containing protein [Syntrophales bacterium]|nr:DUF2275 domain-containing protein [Syntrophales bacterium]